MIPEELLLAKGASRRRLEMGEIIFREGGPSNYYYQLVSGMVRWSNFKSDGEEMLHHLLQAGDVFGEFPNDESCQYTATAVAETPCELLRINVDALAELLKEHPDVHLEFTKLVAEQLRYKFFLTDIICTYSPKMVLLKLINYFNDHGKYICEDCKRLMLTRQQLANMTGLRVETIIRTFKQLEREQQIHIIKGKIFIPADGICSASCAS